MTRAALLDALAAAVAAVERPHPVRVAVDGVDAVGKTTLADELAELLRRRGYCVVRSGIDHFHHPRARRYRRGADSPVGYYEDSFDCDAVLRFLLEPLGSGGSRHVRLAAFDHHTDRAVDSAPVAVPPDGLLIFDGVFLQRPELRDGFDFTIFLDVDFETAATRGVDRDLGTAATRGVDRDLGAAGTNEAENAAAGERAALRSRYMQRYYGGQAIYLERCRPAERADMCVDHRDMDRPIWVTRTAARKRG